MKIVNLVQNGKEWRAWRSRGIGASDCPVVMGLSPWTSPFELWLEKTGLCERAPANEFAIAAMKRGHDLEPEARALFEKEHGAAFPPLSAEHPTHSFLRCSLDGYNEDEAAILEIKCPGKVDHTKALKGKVPDKYMPQIQAQFLVTGARTAYYFSYYPGEPTATIQVNPDSIYLAKLEAAMLSFWKLVELEIAPPTTSKDVKKFVKRVGEDFKRLGSAVKALQILVGE